MSRISEAVAYVMFTLESELNKCVVTQQTVSADGIVGILEDVRLLKCGLLDRNEVLPGGALSRMMIEQRVILRLP